MAVVVPSVLDSYLTKDEYTALRHSQDHHLAREFADLHQSIDGIKRELKEFKEDVKEFKEDVKEFKEDVKEFKEDVKEFKEDVKVQFTAVDQRFNAVDRQFAEWGHRFDIVQLQLNENTAQIRQSAAYSRNSNIKTPLQRITPLVAYRPQYGLVEPDPMYWPRNPDEFYKLRSPTTPAQQKMLYYLLKFYDLSNDPSILPADRSFDDGDIDPSPFPYDPVRAVESLENVLGLDEEKINLFKQRAQQYAAQAPHLASKRPNIPSNNELEHLARRPKLASTEPTSRQPIFPAHQTSSNTTTSDGLDRTRLGWGDRSTPSSQRPRIHGLTRRKTESPPETSEDDRTSQDSSERDDSHHSSPAHHPASPVISQRNSARNEAVKVSLLGEDAVTSQSHKSKQSAPRNSNSPTIAYTTTPKR